MNDEILRLLDSPNSADRKKAIKLMAQSADESALPYLGALYKTDSDPEIRELAVQAGRYIKKQQEVSKWQGKPGTPPPPKEDEEDPEAEKVVISQGDKFRSEDFMNRAMDALTAHNDQKAREFASKAVKINPTLIKDPYYSGLLYEITGVRGEDILTALAGEEKGGKSKKKKNDGSGGAFEEVTWGDAFLSLGIYALVNAGITVVSIVLIIINLQNVFFEFESQMAQDPEFSAIYQAEELASFSQATSMLTGVGVVGGAINGVIAGIANAVAFLVIFGIIHLVATRLLGGDGAMEALVYRLTNFYVIIALIGGVLGIVISYWGSNALANTLLDPNLMTRLDSVSPTSTELDLFSQFAGILPIITLGSLIFGLFVLFRTFSITGSVYQFGWLKGCLSHIIGYIVLSFGFSCCYTTLIGSIIATFS